MVVKEWPESNLLGAADFIQTDGETVKINLGVEYWFLKSIALRAGYKLGYHPNIFTLGLGFFLFRTQLDYGFVSSVIDPTHRISLTAKFGSPEKTELAKKYEEKGMYARAEYIRSPDDYQYSQVVRKSSTPNPIISSIVPKMSTPGSKITIYGNKFNGSREKIKVSFGEYPAEIISANARKIVAKVPSGVPAGAVGVCVETEQGKSASGHFYIASFKSPMLKVGEISFHDENNNQVLEAGEKAEIVFEFSNANGAGKAVNLKAEIQMPRAKFALIYPESLEVGDIEPDSSQLVKIPLSAPLDIPTGEVSLKIDIAEVNGLSLEPIQIKIQTHKLEAPNLQLAKVEIDDGIYPEEPEKLAVGNNNGKIEPGESVEIMAFLVNQGSGKTKNTVAEIFSGDSSITFLRENKINCGEIAPGKWMEIKFAVRVEKKYAGTDNLPLFLKVTDDITKFDREIPLNLTIGRAYSQPQLVDIKGNLSEETPAAIPTFGADLYPIPEGKGGKPAAVAVVVGVRNYKNRDVPTVEYALNDLQLVKEYLTKTLGYRNDNIILLENPTKADFERVFGTKDNYQGQLYNYVQAGKSEVFIYYVGHGAPDLETRSAYFVPADCHPNYVKLNGYPLNQFYENLEQIPAKEITVVVDACFSGGSQKGNLIKNASPLIVEPIKGKFSEKISEFSSSANNQISSWYVDKQHSLFTYFFLKALQGAADKNKDKNLTCSEINSYLAENVPQLARRLYNREQTPQFKGNKNKVLVEYK